MKVVFMGTPDFAVPALKALARFHDVICVYTQPPRPAGKGYQLRSSPVQKAAEELGIPVRFPTTLKSVDEQIEFQELKADVAVVCAYGLILPKAILEAPRLGCINIHASLLPRWRGAAPIQRAIEAGDKQSGVTIMQMDTGLDTGPMLMKETVYITPTTTAGILHDALSEIGADLIVRVLAEHPTPVAQPEEGVTYASKIQKSEALIDWTQEATTVLRKILAFNPFPGAYFIYKEERIKVFEAVVEKMTTTEKAGTLIDNQLRVACGNGTVLRLIQLQREGKKVLLADDFIKGMPMKRGEMIAI